MAIYAALLRGINVGGKNMIKMAELKQLFEAIGLREVSTYIQSGNVLFQSMEEEEPLRNKIEKEIESHFGFAVTVVLRTIEELRWIIQNCPFSEEKVKQAETASEAESLYVAMLLLIPANENIERLNAYKGEKDDFIIEGREVFLLFFESIRKSKIADHLHKLEVPATVRNWNTLNKLVQLAETMKN